MTASDPYRILGLPPDSDVAAVRRAYRRLARRHHPGLHAGTEGSERFAEIVEAYRKLTEVLERAGPPVTLRRLTRTVVVVPAVSLPPPPTEPERDWVVEVGFAEAIRGGVASLTLQREEACPACGGAGCPRCGGRGIQVRLDRLRVRIPAGIEDGARLRIARRSEPGGVWDLRLKVGEHPYFRRSGLDIQAFVPITFAEAVLGGEIEVPTIDGPVRVRLPAGTRGGTRFRLAGRGVRGEQGVGDHYYTVEIAVPAPVGEELESSLRRLAEPSPREALPKTPVE